MATAGGGKSLAPPKAEALRVIAHIDMDAFYAQIEQLRDINLTGKPVVVVQYPTTMHNIEDIGPDDNRVVECSTSSTIAVSYEARKFGVKRGMKAVDAKAKCPELKLVQVPTRNGKADISLYRQNGEKVVKVLEQAGGELTIVEKASIDEVYVDVTNAAQALVSRLTQDSNTTCEDGNLDKRICSSERGGSVNSDGKDRGRQDGGGGYKGKECQRPSNSDVDSIVGGGVKCGTIKDNASAEEDVVMEHDSVLVSATADPEEAHESQPQQLPAEDSDRRHGPVKIPNDRRTSELEISMEGTRSSKPEIPVDDGLDVSVGVRNPPKGEGKMTLRGPPDSWEDRGGWRNIGAGGWTAVVYEALTTHVAGLDDKPREPSGDEDDHDDAMKESTRRELEDERLSWWARPEEEWSEDDRLLACGAAVVSRLRAAVRSELNFSCTAGICHNKLLAKLCSNMHKPNAQTVLPSANVEGLFSVLPVEKVKGWGGKLGVKIMEKLGATTAGEVASAGPAKLQRMLGNIDGWRAWEKSRGIDREPVKARSAPKSIGCSKTFPGKAKLTTLVEIERWMSELCKELCLRLIEHAETEGQTPKTLTIAFAEWQQRGQAKSVSRCCRMVKTEVPLVVAACMRMIKAYKKQRPILSMLGVSAHGFEERPKNTKSIQSFFGGGGGGNNNNNSSSSSNSSNSNGANRNLKRERATVAKTAAMAAATLSSPSPSSPSLSSSPLLSPTSSAAVAITGATEHLNSAELSRLTAVGTGEGRSDTAAAASAAAVGGAAYGADAIGVVDRDPIHEGRSDQGELEMKAKKDTEDLQLSENDSHVGKEVGPTPRLIQAAKVPAVDGEQDGHIWRGDNDTGKDGQAGDRKMDDLSPVDVVGGNEGEWERWPDDGDDVMWLPQQQQQQVEKETRLEVHTPEEKGMGQAERSREECCQNEGSAENCRRRRSSSSTGGEQLLFGRGGSSGGFGDVDPDVLAQLPPEIQREVWMQQGKTRPGSGAKRPRSAGATGSGGGGVGRLSLGRGGGRSQRGRVSASKRPDQRQSISSFFEK